MKSLNLSRPTLLLVIGLPGAGKSCFARQFADMFGASVVSYDRIRYELFAQPRYNADEAGLVGRLAEYQLGELLKTKHSCLIDGGGNAKVDRMRLTKYARLAGYDALTIWVQTDEVTAKSRATKRTKNRDDNSFSPGITPEQFTALASRFTPPTTENHVVISGRHTYSSQAKAVLRKLATPRQTEVMAAHRTANESLQVSRAATPARRRLLL